MTCGGGPAGSSTEVDGTSAFCAIRAARWSMRSARDVLIAALR
jgi:hypothetical protein